MGTNAERPQARTLADLWAKLATVLTGIIGSGSKTLTDVVSGLTTLHTDVGTTVHADLATTLHNDLNTTLHGDLATTLHADLATTLHGDLATTLHGDLTVAGGIPVLPNGRNATVLAVTTLTWEIADITVKAVDVTLPSPMTENVLVCIKNTAAGSALSVTLNNFHVFDGAAEASYFTSLSIAASQKRDIAVAGFPRGTKGQVSIVKDTNDGVKTYAYVIVLAI